MSRDLAQRLMALGLGRHAHTDTTILLPANGDTGWLAWRPSAPFKATIAYWFTFPDMPPGIFRIWALHDDYPLGTKLIMEDEMQHGSANWFYITDARPLLFRVLNLDSQAQTFDMTTFHLNIETLQLVDLIKLIAWESMAPASLLIAIDLGISPSLPNLPADTIEKFKKYRGLP